MGVDFDIDDVNATVPFSSSTARREKKALSRPSFQRSNCGEALHQHFTLDTFHLVYIVMSTSTPSRASRLREKHRNDTVEGSSPTASSSASSTTVLNETKEGKVATTSYSSYGNSSFFGRFYSVSSPFWLDSDGETARQMAEQANLFELELKQTNEKEETGFIFGPLGRLIYAVIPASVMNSVHELFHRTPRRIAWSWTALMLLLLIMCTFLTVEMSYCQRDMSTALGDRNQDAFYVALVRYFQLICIACPLLALSQYAKSQLAIYWRLFLTNKLLKKYFNHRNYYILQTQGNGSGINSLNRNNNGNRNSGNKKKPSRMCGSVISSSSSSAASTSISTQIDNPDQRMADDIRAFTRSSLTFANELLDELMQVIGFSSILWTISPMLVLFLVIYAFVGTLIATIWFGKRLVRSNGKQAKLEADFRYSLVRIRTFAEGIAFYNGEATEYNYILYKFEKIIYNLQTMNTLQYFLSFFKHSYGYLTLLIPPVILSPLYFNGKIQLGIITQGSMAFQKIFSSLNLLINKMNELTKWNTGMERIYELQEKLNEIECENENQFDSPTGHIQASDEGMQEEDFDFDSNRISKTEVSWSHASTDDDSTIASTNSPVDHSNSDSITFYRSQHLRLHNLTVFVHSEVSDASSTETGDRILVEHLTLCIPSLRQGTLQHAALQAWEALFPSQGNGHALQRGGEKIKPRGLLIMGSSGTGWFIVFLSHFSCFVLLMHFCLTFYCLCALSYAVFRQEYVTSFHCRFMVPWSW